MLVLAWAQAKRHVCIHKYRHILYILNIYIYIIMYEYMFGVVCMLSVLVLHCQLKMLIGTLTQDLNFIWGCTSVSTLQQHSVSAINQRKEQSQRLTNSRLIQLSNHTRQKQNANSTISQRQRQKQKQEQTN